MLLIKKIHLIGIFNEIQFCAVETVLDQQRPGELDGNGTYFLFRQTRRYSGKRREQRRGGNSGYSSYPSLVIGSVSRDFRSLIIFFIFLFLQLNWKKWWIRKNSSFIRCQKEPLEIYRCLRIYFRSFVVVTITFTTPGSGSVCQKLVPVRIRI